LILDEPANGLDPDGIVWMRRFLRRYVEQGRSVLVSSHVLTEMQQLVDRVVILDQGRLVRQGSLAELAGTSSTVLVRTPQSARLSAAVQRSHSNGVRVDRVGPDTLHVLNLPADAIGRIALAEQVELHELTPRASDLEQIFFSLTGSTQGEVH
jgi:ABC-2 type transport system ATP-binding protein